LLWRSGITETATGSGLSDSESSSHSHDAIQPLFPLGQIVATSGALTALERASQTATELLRPHLAGDWGSLDAHDIAENEYSLAHGFRLLSSYRTTAGERVWVITEADRSITSLILPEEY